MRRLAVLGAAGAAFFALVALALASGTPNVTYRSPIKEKGKANARNPAPLSYRGILDVSEPDGSQPPTGATTKLYFAKGLLNMGKYFPSCSQKQIDGKPSFPAKCKKAIVGKGTASSDAGTPGQPPAIKEPLNVTAVNGPKGKQILLVLNATTPVAVQNRVIPGKLGKGGGKFAYTVTFVVPKDLQQQLGLQISLTHFDVTIARKLIRAKVGGKKRKISYLMLSKCPKSKKLPAKAVVHFNKDDGSPGGPVVTATSTFACK